MAINKNFVVKNGFEVNSNLIYANAETNKVGIASTGPRTEFDVRGGIACTDFRAVGVATIQTLKNITGIVTDLLSHNATIGVATVGSIQGTYLNITGFSSIGTLQVNNLATISVGVVTFLNGTNINYSGIGTIVTFNSTSARSVNLNVSGVSTIVNSRTTNLNVSGISTFSGGVNINQGANLSGLNVAGITTLGQTNTTGFSNSGLSTLGNATATTLNVTGIATITNVDINGGDIQVASLETNNLNASGITTISNLSVNGSTFNNLSVTQFTNLSGVTTISNATGNNINFSGIGSIGGFLFSNGIVTSTSLGAGIVTFYGDGSQLQFLPQASPAGSNTEVQFNASGVFSGNPGFTYNYQTVSVPSLNVSTGATVSNLNASSSIIVGSGVSISSNKIDGGSTVRILGSSLKVVGVATAQDFDALSDLNYKKNVSSIDGALDKVTQLRGVKFDWKETGLPSYGVIAQELEQVLPELVHGTDPRTVNYNGIIGVLIEAIKELKREIDVLKT